MNEYVMLCYVHAAHTLVFKLLRGRFLGFRCRFLGNHFDLIWFDFFIGRL